MADFEDFKGEYTNPVGTGIMVNDKLMAFFAWGQDYDPYVKHLQTQALKLNTKIKIERCDYLDNPHRDVIVVLYG